MSDDIRPGEELVALAMAIWCRCSEKCGRFATWESKWVTGVCDACKDKLHPACIAIDGWKELPQAKRARRFEALLTRETRDA